CSNEEFDKGSVSFLPLFIYLHSFSDASMGENEQVEASEEDLVDTNYYPRRDWTNPYHCPQQFALCRYDEQPAYAKEMIIPYPPVMWNRQDTALSSSSLRCIDPNEIYCTVPGRTSLLSSTTKYNVSVGEIQRRINQPECLNASLLGGILRKAKSKDGGKSLRESLRKLGIILPAGRRKQTTVTAWTALVEEEAIHMGRDFALVCEKEFHCREVSVHLVKPEMSDGEYTTRRMTLMNARQVVDELMTLISSDTTPVTGLPLDSRPILHPFLQEHLSHFSLVSLSLSLPSPLNYSSQVTHGFGCIAISSSLGIARSIIDEAITFLDRSNAHFAPFPQHKIM
ncbi:hypothetical protein PMAYCL1PPCAC_23652, partial [Pristionchus mayeri]